MPGRQFSEHGRAFAVSLLTVTVCASAFGQTTRISNSNPDLDSLSRLQATDGFSSRTQGNSLLYSPSQADLSKIDQRQLATMMRDALNESTALYRILDAESVRNRQLIPLLRELLQLRAQASRIDQDLTNRVDLRDVMVSFRQLDQAWRTLSHQLSQSPGLSREAIASVERLDRIDREVGKLFQVEPTLDRRELLRQLATLSNAFRNLIDELLIAPTGGTKIAQLVTDSRKVQQQVQRVEQVVLENYPYEQIVIEYSRFTRMWTTLLDQLRTYDDRYVERQVRYLVDANNSVKLLLWIDNKSDRAMLQQMASTLMRDVDEFYNRTPLKLLLNVKNLTAAMQTANDFYGTVQNFKDMIDREQSDAQVLDSYRYVEEYGYMFTRTFSAMNSQAARIVLRNIEDGIASLRSELHLAGTVSQVDYRQLLPIAARLELLSDNLDWDVRRWLTSDRQTFRDEALLSSKNFMTRTRRLHQLMQGQPSVTELQRETAALMDEWTKLYNFLGRCNTVDRPNLASLAGEIRRSISELSVPLQL